MQFSSTFVLLKLFYYFQLALKLRLTRKMEQSSAKEEKMIMSLCMLEANQRKWSRCSLFGSETNKFIKKICSL